MFDYSFLSNVFSTVMRMTTPVLFAGMAAVVGAQADILCIGYEGIMLFAAFGGVLGSAYSQSLMVGTLCGLLAGILMMAFFAYFVLYLNTRPLLVGLSINTLSSGGTIFFVYLLTGMKLNTSKLPSLQFPNIEIPIIRDIPVLSTLLSNHNILTYLAFVSVVFVWILLFKTKLGLRIRAVGQNQAASASVGINVKKTKFIAMLISGLLASFGGMYMSMGYLPYFTTDMVAGRGFLGIAAQRLGASHPVFVMLITILFGAATAAGNIAQSYRLPSQFALMTPYLVTLIGLIIMGEIARRKNKTELKKVKSILAQKINGSPKNLDKR